MPEPIPLRGPRFRKAAIPAHAEFVVRGSGTEPDEAHRQATDFRRRFPDWGRYGLSGYYAGGDESVDDRAADELDRFPEVIVFRIDELRSSGFDVVPTFRTPHVTIAFAGDIENGLARLEKLKVEHFVNPYHDPAANS